MKKHIMIALTLLGILTFAIAGCTSKAGTDEEAADPTPAATEEPAASAAPENDDDTKDTDEADSVEEENAETKVTQTPLEDIQGEGSTDSEVPDLENIETAPLEEDYDIADEAGDALCTIRVDNAQLTDERDPNNASDPEQVLIIDYTYTTNAADPLLVDDMSFKFVVDGNVCTPYYANFLVRTQEPVANGESSSAQVAFEVSSDFKEGTLVFDNGEAGEEVSFVITLK